MNPLIELKGVSKAFHANGTVCHAIQKVDFELKPKEVVVILGPSGSGKSTLLRCVNGLELIDEGSVSVFGEDLNRAGRGIGPLRARMVMVFQRFNLFANLTVLDNLVLPQCKVLKVKKQDAERRALEILNDVGIAEKASAFPHQLSGGQQQRVGIARALAMRSEVLLCDEPTSALDPEIVNDILLLIKDLAKKGTGMIVVTHEVGFAKEIADRVIFMEEGEIVEQGAAPAIFDDPKTERFQNFLSKVL